MPVFFSPLDDTACSETFVAMESVTKLCTKTSALFLDYILHTVYILANWYH